METNLNRIKDLIEKLATYNDTPDDGITRFSYSANDCKVRDYLIEICKSMGLNVRVDSVGNIFARLQGTEQNLPIVMTGSHIDSVKNGGKYDGIVGSVGSLESVRTLIENRHKPKHSIDVVFFAEEEGSNFQVPVMGSKVLVGKLCIEDLKNTKNEEGKSAYEVMRNVGLNPDQLSRDVIKKGDIKAMLELHIEQSVRLDMEKHQVGIIQGIVGLKWLKITLTGCSNHAGATPMHLRNDPMVVASQIISKINIIAKEVSNTTVATVGNIVISPNIPNAIPGVVTFTVDIRDINQSGIDSVVEEIEKLTVKCSRESGVEYDVATIATSKTIKIQPYIMEIMENKAKQLGLDYIMMPSGAVHDSNYMADVTDVGMIFVPSKDGRSHVKEEYTSYEDIKAGADLLLNTLIELAE